MNEEGRKRGYGHQRQVDVAKRAMKRRTLAAEKYLISAEKKCRHDGRNMNLHSERRVQQWFK
jgi:hypothetical protein